MTTKVGNNAYNTVASLLSKAESELCKDRLVDVQTVLEEAVETE